MKPEKMGSPLIKRASIKYKYKINEVLEECLNKELGGKQLELRHTKVEQRPLLKASVIQHCVRF